MMQFNRKTLSLAVALGASLAMPAAFAQVTKVATDVQATVGAATGATPTADAGISAQATTPVSDANVSSQAHTSASDASTSASMQATTPAAQTDTAAQADTSTTAATGTPAKKSWTDLDADKNGNLSQTEAGEIDSLAKVFVDADADADGELTPDEYKAYLAAHGKASAGNKG